MILPTEPIRGKTFAEYVEAAWAVDEDEDVSFMVFLTSAILRKTPEELKAMPKQIQVYWFERARAMMLEALKSDRTPPDGTQVDNLGRSEEHTQKIRPGRTGH